MKRLSLFCAMGGLLLGSASLPQPRAAESPRLAYARVDCAPHVGFDCAALAGDTQVAAVSPSGTAESRVPEAGPPQPAEAVVPAEPIDPGAGVRVVVSLPLQTAYVFEDGELVATSPVSTGKRGHRTPTGTFPILQKKKHHRSTTYDNAPMPYMQRLTWQGIALHAGRVPGYPASHGCIRLPWSFARKLYGLTDYDTRVTITDKRPKSADEALSLA